MQVNDENRKKFTKHIKFIYFAIMIAEEFDSVVFDINILSIEEKMMRFAASKRPASLSIKKRIG